MCECFFQYWPTWVILDKRPSNSCACVCVCYDKVYVFYIAAVFFFLLLTCLVGEWEDIWPVITCASNWQRFSFRTGGGNIKETAG